MLRVRSPQPLKIVPAVNSRCSGTSKTGRILCALRVLVICHIVSPLSHHIQSSLSLIRTLRRSVVLCVIKGLCV